VRTAIGLAVWFLYRVALGVEVLTGNFTSDWPGYVLAVAVGVSWAMLLDDWKKKRRLR